MRDFSKREPPRMKAKSPPSPCIGVCKFKRAGHCIGCSMTKDQKTICKKLKKPAQKRAFLDLLLAQQAQLGKFEHWRRAYMRKCAAKGAAPLRAE